MTDHPDIFKAALLIAGLILGNFLYQMLTFSDWNSAIERSFFQLIGCLAMYAVLKMKFN